jgi:hypothetical protein
MIDYFLEKKIIHSIEKSRKETEDRVKFFSHEDPYKIFEKILNSKFGEINNFIIVLTIYILSLVLIKF